MENDTVRVNYHTANSGLKHNWITAIVAAGGDWFAGTYGAGVFRLDRHWRAGSVSRSEGGLHCEPQCHGGNREPDLRWQPRIAACFY